MTPPYRNIRKSELLAQNYSTFLGAERYFGRYTTALFKILRGILDFGVSRPIRGRDAATTNWTFGRNFDLVFVWGFRGTAVRGT